MKQGELRTVNDIIGRVLSRGSAPVMSFHDLVGGWKSLSSDDTYGWVRAVAQTLKDCGVGKGDRVVILAENRWEWTVTDYAVLALGAVDVPLYATTAASQVGYMVRDSGAKVAVVSTREQMEKLVEAGEMAELQHVLVMDDGMFGDATSFGELKEAARLGRTRDADFDAHLGSAQPDDLCTIIYTSGTTGVPKGVQLTHDNLVTNIVMALPQFGACETDRCISYLPLSHIFERHVDYALLMAGGLIAYCPTIELLPAAMKAIKPTFFVGVPRVYEKVRQGVEAKSAASPVKNAILKWALTTGQKHRAQIIAGTKPSAVAWKIANKLVYQKIFEAFGGSVRVFVSGSAPLGMATCNWFADAGIHIYEGYGLTETSPVVSFNHPGKNRMGTVGPALENMQMRIAGDGEIEVKGPSVFGGYWKKPKETEEVFTEDGWFKTGDIGEIDGDGFLSITDRKKEILKTSGGKMVAPQPIENLLKAHGLVANAALVGDKHKYVSVIIAPNFAGLEGWAKANGVNAGGRAELVKHDKVKAEFQRIVDEVNKRLSHHETLKRMALVPDEWTIESGELTPSMKMKRRIVEKKYEKEIAEFYADEANSRAD